MRYVLKMFKKAEPKQLLCLGILGLTLVTVIKPRVELYDVVEWQQPISPARMPPIPSAIIPRLDACLGGCPTLQTFDIAM